MNNRQRFFNSNVYDTLYSMNSVLLSHQNYGERICIIDLLRDKIPFNKSCCGDCCTCLQKFLNYKGVDSNERNER